MSFVSPERLPAFRAALRKPLENGEVRMVKIDDSKTVVVVGVSVYEIGWAQAPEGSLYATAMASLAKCQSPGVIVALEDDAVTVGENMTKEIADALLSVNGFVAALCEVDQIFGTGSLAGILAHEIGHAVRGHTTRADCKVALAQVGVVLSNPTHTHEELEGINFSFMEKEADEFAASVHFGEDLLAVLKKFVSMAEERHPGDPIPGLDKRIAHLESIL